ncbi:FAD-dependent oxidoreductase [Desulfurivibrio dismutans]|uniref:FAD-dependent oxidoreductase n=1 Tax=Desulfurivibrio dismutans TaxID=1398908 RepID=UPI0023DBF95C|nr:FAD-dependent oxidoreductase [Desulfurivibrio alkaliphilus]MDF1614533.1 FAD-dependent oxidoreductase [Desulfurivibrio alkaliphilus]
MSRKIVIIGGVAAGPKTACRLKRLLPDAEVRIIDQDSLISYGGCGIPYYVSGDVSDEKELRNTSFHLTRDEPFFAKAKGVTVSTRTRALSVNRQGKKVLVEKLGDGSREEIPYDQLVLATGSRPNVLPIPGADLERVFTISDLHQAITIKELIAKGQVDKAVVIGGGAIGIEMAEAFVDLWGLKASILEFMPQLLPRLVDWEFAGMLEQHLKDKGVDVFTGEGATAIEGEAGRAQRVVTPQRTLEADLVVMAVGVRARSELAQEAGLLVDPQGNIVVNEHLQTSDPDIYAAGDCIAVKNRLTGKSGIAPMGSLANKEGRIVADNLAGIPTRYQGWVGSFILKAFERCLGATGLTLETARAEGFDAAAVTTAQSDRAHFFPTQAVIPLRMVFDRRDRRLLGVQGFGPMGDAVLARIDAAAALLQQGATIDDVSQVEMAYAPPFATALDALNATANVADNLAAGRLRCVDNADYLAWMEDFASRPDWVALDIRHPNEASVLVDKFGTDQWLSIPYIEVRDRYQELPTDKMMIIICDAGTRSSEIQIFLDSVGLNNNLVLSGGFNLIRRLGVPWLG